MEGKSKDTKGEIDREEEKMWRNLGFFKQGIMFLPSLLIRDLGLNWVGFESKHYNRFLTFKLLKKL